MNKSRKCRYGALLLASLLAGTVTVQSSLAYIVTQSQTAVNTFKPKPVLEGGLIISKTVQHPYGAEYAVPDGITFDFNVSLGSYYAGYTLDTTAGSVTADRNGDIQLTVEQGEYIGIENLEDGMTVLVSEIQQNDDGFTVLDNITDMSLTISADDTAYADFINIYDPAPAVPENVFIYGEKILYGRDWQDGDSFKFILAQQDANGNWNNIGTEEIIYDGSEDFSIFDFSSIIQTIELDALGSHTFRITEESGSLENMTYDSAECIFEIVVSDDDMDGSMEI
ncbi:MAG: hypothetical protein IJY74_04280, partial [Oscillospiraceae bacterium]|nr:hypothetical protein [Oscillospiraceae bacterium]